MISCEDKKRLQELICQEFPEYSKEKREQMVEALVKKEGACFQNWRQVPQGQW